MCDPPTIVDFLDRAKKRLRSLERLWLCVMTIGSIILIFARVNNGANSPQSVNYAVPMLFYAAFGLAGVPFLINKALPILNLWTPWKDRKTIWETECLVFVITLSSLSWTSACFFGLPFRQAAKIQILLGLAAFPILWITARQRWQTHLLATPEAKGDPDEAYILQSQDDENRLKKNITAYLIAAVICSIVQLTTLSISMLIMGKTAVFNLFPTLILVSLIVNLLLPPIGVGLAKHWIRNRALRPSANFFIGTSLFTIGAIGLPYFSVILRALGKGDAPDLQFGSYETSLAITVSSFIFGYLIGALCFEKFYHPESEASKFT